MPLVGTLGWHSWCPTCSPGDIDAGPFVSPRSTRRFDEVAVRSTEKGTNARRKTRTGVAVWIGEVFLFDCQPGGCGSLACVCPDPDCGMRRRTHVSACLVSDEPHRQRIRVWGTGSGDERRSERFFCENARLRLTALSL